jgi:hypothetical protein
MIEPETEPQQMVYDAECEREDARTANEWRLPTPCTPEVQAVFAAACARREAEDAARDRASERYYTETPEGRAAAARVDAAMRVRLAVFHEENPPALPALTLGGRLIDIHDFDELRFA